jgi:hypothetical protein
MANDDAPAFCAVCSLSREDHTLNNVHHEFSIDGVLVPRPQRPSSTPGQGISSADVTLRLITLLRAKGILTQEDLGLIFPTGDLHETASTKLNAPL